MRTAIYNKVKRLAALFIAGCAMTTGVMAQESLHLFYKDGEHKKLEITDSSFVEFVKQPFIEELYYSSEGDTIQISAGAGRTMNYGAVRTNMMDWDISTDASWLAIRKNKRAEYRDLMGGGMMMDYFLIFADANQSNRSRTATVTISSNSGGILKELTVLQHPFKLSLQYMNPLTGFEPTTSLEEFIQWNDTVFYAYAYPGFNTKIQSYPSWMVLDTLINTIDWFSLDDVAQVPDSIRITHENIGDSYTFARFYFEPNNALESRSGEIVFRGGGQEAVLTVTQEGLNEQTIFEDAAEMFKKMYACGEAIGSSYHTDFGYPALMLLTDSRGADMVCEDIGYNWFSLPMTYEDIASGYWPTALYWSALYNQIQAANEVILTYGNDSEKSLFQFYLAQARALRAFSYFYLAQMYQHTYVGNEEEPCVPIIDESNMNTVRTEGCPRASVREVYDFILSDLEQALELLRQTEVTTTDKQFLNTTSIYGLLARVNLVMNRWEEAAKYAQFVIESEVASPYERYEVSYPTFTDINHSAWLWGIDTEESDHVVTTGIINWPSHMGSLNYGYASVGAWRRISSSLYNAIPSTDVRKGWFLNEQGYSPNLNSEQASYVAYAGCYPFTQMKFGTYNDVIEQNINANDIPLMRIEEMYLIWVEAQAMLGNMEEATEVLNDFVQEYRDYAYTCKATTPEELVDAVWMQRRIELWGEGHSYFDLMRMKKGVDRRGAGFQEAYVYSIPADDATLIYPIPNREMNNNSQLVQNPEAEMPQPVAEIEFVAYKNGVFTSELFEGSWEQAMEVHLTDKNLYRLPDYISAGYDLLFYWDETTGEVAFAKDVWETGYVHNQYGMIMAYAQSIAYDEATKTFTFVVEYRVDAGTLGVMYETFTLPNNDEEEEPAWQWFSADAEGNQIVVDTEDEASFINFAEGWWGEYFYDVRIKFIEEDGLRHCVAYRDDGIWGEGMGIEFHFTMATEPNEMGEYDLDVPRQYFGYDYAAQEWLPETSAEAPIYFYDWYNYFITDGGYADTTWVDADDFYAKNGASYPRSYSDGKGGFYFNMKYHVPAAGGGWTPDKFDIVATIQGTYREACEMALNFKYVYDGKALVDVRMISYVEYVKYVCVKGALSNSEIAQYADSLRNDVNNIFNVLYYYDDRELKLAMEEYGAYTFIAVPFDASGAPRRPEVGKLCQAITFEYNEPNFVETGYTGTYTYAHSLSEETTDSGLRLYKDVNNQNFYCIRDWFTGIDFTFIWDGESEVEVMDQFTGYNEVYIVDAIQHMYGKSYYDAETRTFHFKVMYHTHNEDGTYAGTHAIGEETFVLDEEETYTSYELLGTGTYTYTCMYAEPSVDSGYKLYRDTNNEDTYVITDWFYGVNFTFTWDGDSDVRVLNQFSGYTDSFGNVFVMEASEYNTEWSDVKSYYDAETKTFYFAIVYYCDAGYYGYGYETFTLDEEQAAAMSRSRERMSTPTLKIQKPRKMIEISNKEELLIK